MMTFRPSWSLRPNSLASVEGPRGQATERRTSSLPRLNSTVAWLQGPGPCWPSQSRASEPVHPFHWFRPQTRSSSVSPGRTPQPSYPPPTPGRPAPVPFCPSTRAASAQLSQASWIHDSNTVSRPVYSIQSVSDTQSSNFMPGQVVLLTGWRSRRRSSLELQLNPAGLTDWTDLGITFRSRWFYRVGKSTADETDDHAWGPFLGNCVPLLRSPSGTRHVWSAWAWKAIGGSTRGFMTWTSTWIVIRGTLSALQTLQSWRMFGTRSRAANIRQ